MEQVRTFTPYDRYLRTKSGLAFGLCVAFTIFIIGLLALVTGYLLWLGASSLSVEFFTQEPSGDTINPGGMRNALVGTLMLILIASLIGIPMGILAGIYLSEYAAESLLAAPVRFVSDVLAGVPSIVVGILGYELLVRPLSGYNGWAGAVALAFIMVPIVARTTEEMLRLVPNSYREAAIGLGATKAQTIVQVVLPAAKGSLITGVMLAIARVAGETAPLMFTALGSRFTPVRFDSTFPFVHMDIGQPFPSLTMQVYTYVSGPAEAQHRQGWAGILVLIALIFVLNLAIRYFASRTTMKGAA